MIKRRELEKRCRRRRPGGRFGIITASRAGQMLTVTAKANWTTTSGTASSI